MNSPETGFYQGMGSGPQGLIDFVSAVLDKSATSVAMFRGLSPRAANGFVDGRNASIACGWIVPHIRRTIIIARLLDLKVAETGGHSPIRSMGLTAGLYLRR